MSVHEFYVHNLSKNADSLKESRWATRESCEQEVLSAFTGPSDIF